MKINDLQIWRLQVAHSQQHAGGECCNTNARALFKVRRKKEKRQQAAALQKLAILPGIDFSRRMKFVQKKVKKIQRLLEEGEIVEIVFDRRC
jgi:hypothetical protein